MIDPELQQKLNMTVQELDLSVRANNCLESAKIGTVRDLVKKTDADLLKVRSFGKTSLREVKRKLADMGLSLGMDLDNVPTRPRHHGTTMTMKRRRRSRRRATTAVKGQSPLSALIGQPLGVITDNFQPQNRRISHEQSHDPRPAAQPRHRAPQGAAPQPGAEPLRARQDSARRLPKAKEVRAFAEKLITLARTEHAEQPPPRHLDDAATAGWSTKSRNSPGQTVVQKLFDEVAPKFADRQGGYTRIIKTSDYRIGDGGNIVLLQLLTEESAHRHGPPLAGPAPQTQRAPASVRRREAAKKPGVRAEQGEQRPSREAARPGELSRNRALLNGHLPWRSTGSTATCWSTCISSTATTAISPRASSPTCRASPCSFRCTTRTWWPSGSSTPPA